MGNRTVFLLCGLWLAHGLTLKGQDRDPPGAAPKQEVGGGTPDAVRFASRAAVVYDQVANVVSRQHVESGGLIALIWAGTKAIPYIRMALAHALVVVTWRTLLFSAYASWYVFSWLLSQLWWFSIGLAYGVARLNRKADVVHGGPPATLGYFRWNNQSWYRHDDGTLSSVKVDGGTFVTAGEDAGRTVVNFTIVDAATAVADTSPGEGALEGVPSASRPGKLFKGQVALYTESHAYFSSAMVFNNMLIFGRHKTSSLPCLLVKGTNATGGVRLEMSRAIKLTDFPGVPEWNENAHTCTHLDFQVVRLSKDEISMIGVKSYADKDFTRCYEDRRGTIVYGSDAFGTLVQETGTIPGALESTHNLGLALAKIPSDYGSSFAPVVVVNDGDKVAGMWLGRPTRSLAKYRDTHNLFMTTDCILQNLCRMGLYEVPIFTQLKALKESFAPKPDAGEALYTSNETKAQRRMREYYEYMEAMHQERQYWLGHTAGDGPVHDTEDRIPWELADNDDQERIHGSGGMDRYDWSGDSGFGRGSPPVRPTVKTPYYKLPARTNAPVPPEAAEQLEEIFTIREAVRSEAGEAAVEALNIALSHNKTTLDQKVRKWKHDILDGKVGAVLRDISYWIEESSDNVFERLNAIKALPSLGLHNDYVKALAPKTLGNPEDKPDLLDRDGKPYFRFVGTCGATRRFTKAAAKRENDNDAQRLVRDLVERYHERGMHGCTAGRYVVPKSCKENVEKSLRAQAKRATVSSPQLTTDEFDDLTAAIEYAKAKHGQGLKVLGGGGSATIPSYIEQGTTGVLKALIALEEKSSGASARYRNKKKASYARDHPEEVVDLALCRFILIAAAGAQITELSAMQLVEHGLVDVKDVVMKDEGHSPRKIREERYRLLWISSLIDLVLQSLLHKADNLEHISAFQRGDLTCAAVGMGHSDDGIKALVAAFEAEKLRENITSDASAYDLSVDEIFIRADGTRRKENCQDPDVGRFIERYAHILCNHVLNNHGDLWLCLKKGVTTSGQLSTTAQNTFGRGCMAAFARCLNWVNVSDDLVADKYFDEARMELLGISSRDVQVNHDLADFTSHIIDFDTCTARFNNVEKMLWNTYEAAKDISTNRERFGGCLSVLRNTPGVYDDLHAIAVSLYPDIDGYIYDNAYSGL